MMLDKLIERVKQTKHGFRDIQKAADEFVGENSSDKSLQTAKSLFVSDDYQVRAFATFILGRLAADSEESIVFLRKVVSQDKDWRVQEIFAKSFDRYCSDSGYEKVLNVIHDWLKDPSPNVRRAVTEGLRIWTGRPYFQDNPNVAICILSELRNDESEYVRKSVGNALRDISKKHEDLIRAELAKWKIENKEVKQTYKLASKFL